jgi:hypothetical protein
MENTPPVRTVFHTIRASLASLPIIPPRESTSGRCQGPILKAAGLAQESPLSKCGKAWLVRKIESEVGLKEDGAKKGFGDLEGPNGHIRP